LKRDFKRNTADYLQQLHQYLSLYLLQRQALRFGPKPVGPVSWLPTAKQE
jgi:hypothetical protein